MMYYFVTVLSMPILTLFQSTVWGVAYEIAPEVEEEVTSHLDFREKGGYKQTLVTFYPKDKTENSFDLTIYVGTEDNPFYLGDAPEEEVAHQIFHSTGPSGHNSEYLFELANAMRQIAPGVQDEHLFKLENLVRNLSDSASVGRH